jgi:hypothetical protein
LRVPKAVKGIASKIASLDRNFLHAASLELLQPRTGKALSFSSSLPDELQAFLEELRNPKPRAE